MQTTSQHDTRAPEFKKHCMEPGENFSRRTFARRVWQNKTQMLGTLPIRVGAMFVGET